VQSEVFFMLAKQKELPESKPKLGCGHWLAMRKQEEIDGV
jgi:hypothetical protein